MNSKILKTLDYQVIIDRLSRLTVTQPARQKAQDLLPSTDFDTVKQRLKQTLALTTMMRFKGPLPLSDFQTVTPAVKRLKVKANLNAPELGNILLVLTLAEEVNAFIADLADRDIDLSALKTTIAALEVPAELLQALRRSVEFDGTVLDTASSALARIRHDLAANEEDIKRQMAAYLKSSAQYLSEAIITIRDDRYVIPVKQEYRNKFGGVVHDQSASGQTLFIEPKAVLNLNNRQQAMLAQEKKEIRHVLKALSDLAREFELNISEIAQALAELDFMSAKAKLAQGMSASEPILSTNQQIALRQARHPLIDPDQVIPNDIRLGQDFDTMLITGPNTGGKTITLKTVGLLQLMAQAGLFIPAGEGSLVGVFTQIYADIGDEQSIEQSLSTFSAHMDNIIAIMKHVNNQTLVLIDELGAGTDPEEGSRLAMSILDFMRAHQAKLMVTTHYPELKLYGYNKPGTLNASMEFDVKRLAPTYRLQIGIPGQSNAFAIAQRLGMAESVIKQAKSLMTDADSDLNQMITRLNQQTKAATKTKAHFESRLAQSEQLVDQLTHALDWYHQRIEQQLQFAQEKTNQMLSKRRKQAERLIAQLQQQVQAGVVIKENKLIDAKGQLNQLQREADNLVQNKVLKREKKRHLVKVGDRVKVLSYGQVGTITHQLGAHDFEVQIGIIKAKVSDRDVEKLMATENEPKRQASSGMTTLRRSAAHSELDLRGQRYDEALSNLDRYLDGALLAGLDTVTIIHGIGTGAIRKGVWQYLKRAKHVKAFNYAPANEGGTGATIVSLK